jgi:SAM-dependent methyltransferase
MLTTVQPEPWVIKFSSRVPSGPVLDLACGKGRHGRYFFARGHSVTFLDRDISGVEDLLSHPKTQLMEYDLENNNPWPFHKSQFSGIVVTNYLYRPLLPHLLTALKPGGIIIYKTFATGNEQFGKPRNSDFLLQKNELLEAFGQHLEVIGFVQGKELNPSRVTQAICARRMIHR